MERVAREFAVRCVLDRATKDERAGNFSGATYNDGQPVQVLVPNVSPAINPTVCQPGGTTNSIAASCISPAATALLNSIPLPNIMPNVPRRLPARNFHYVNSAESSSDTVILRLIKHFGQASGPGSGAVLDRGRGP